MLAATPLLRLYAKWRARAMTRDQAASLQRDELLRLVRRAAKTQFGRDHGFDTIRSVEDYQARVPLRTYDDFWRDYWGEPFPHLVDCTWPGPTRYFARTSGTTTGVTKFIPFSDEMLSANIRAAWDILFFHLRNRPQSQVLGGKCFMLGGSTDLQLEAPGIHSGDISGIEAKELPWWGRRYAFPPLDVALLTDWEEKIKRIAALSLSEDIRAIGGTPNWLLIYFDELAALRPDLAPQLANFFPKLELMVHGGIDFKPYAQRFHELLQGSDAELREVYPASEAFIAIADRSSGEGLRMLLDNGAFFEFVPLSELTAVQPTRHWAGTIETGVNYAIVLSTCAGAWSYILGDTVTFIGLDPPRLLVTGRTTYVLSAFGEHVIAAEIEQAIAKAAEEIRAAVTDYCVSATLPEGEEASGHHHFVVETAQPVPEAARRGLFASALDRHLAAVNEDYATHRSGDFGLQPPVVTFAPAGSFAAWMKRRDKLGGQHKVPRVIRDPALFEDVLASIGVTKETI
ncbi:MAG: GH3 auxin-responsive promoter family protein [Pseudomonadota bacterium]